MRKFLLFSKSLILLLLVGLITNVTHAQNNPNESSGGSAGFFIKKVVSNTTIATGVNFSYTIIFSAPAGTPSISIQDIVPASLTVVSIAPLSPVCGINPAVSTIGNTVNYTLTGLPGACTPSGSFTIVVKFPEGVTCNGTSARNQAGIMVNGKYEYTGFVTTTATAVDPWVIGKSIVSGAAVNPNGGSCGYLVPLDGTVTYRLSVTKANPYYGNVVGQHNMTSAVVTDILPANAIFVGSTCGAILVGNTITWNVSTTNPGACNAANPWAYYYCDIQIKYPAAFFPNLTTMQNQATLSGTICQQPASHTSNQTCVQVGQIVPNPQAYFAKYQAITNRVPGCPGYYQIVFCNNGNVPLTAFNITDIIPAGITVNQVQVYGPSAASTVTLTANGGANVMVTNTTTTYTSANPVGFAVNNLSLQMTGTLPVGACLNLVIYFTVNPNPTGTVVTNCATFVPLANSITLPQSCASFTVQQGLPEPCLLKDICAPKTNYSPGDTIRFRIRVQNIGAANLTGASFADVLNANFTYLGNESYFVANTYSPPCSTGSAIPGGTTAWTGVTTAHAGNNLNWSLPTIPSDCQLFYNAYCGYYGTWGLPYYFIEFDVVVSNTALPGVTPNKYTISGGNLSAPYTSNTVNVLVVASFGQEALKKVSTDNGVTYGSSGTIAPGGTARYQLIYKNMSNVPVSTIKLADLLGKNDSPNDWLILNRVAPRGSQFDITYGGAATHTTTLLPVAAAPTPTIDHTAGNNICLTDFGINTGCFPVTWTAPNQRNIRVQYNTFILGPTKSVLQHFDVGIPATATAQQQVCNDFAAVSSATFLLNSITPTVVALTPISAAPVCLTVKPAIKCCDSVKVTKVQGADCCAKITTTCEVKSITVQVTNGTLASVNWNCGPLPVGYVGQSSYTFAANNCILDMNVCLNATAPGVSLMFIINFTNGQVCDKSFQMDCQIPPNCCDSIKIGKPQGTECCARIVSKCEIKSIKVTVNNGTISAASWNCGVLPAGYAGQSSFLFVPASACAVDLTLCVNATMPGVSIDYLIVFADGKECSKSFKMDCKVPESCCAKVDFALKSKWPFVKTLVGNFTITNLDPTSPICYVDIQPSPAGSFSIGSLIVDGVTSAQSWTSTRIPTTGNLSPSAVNTIKFNLVASNYNGIITVCVVKCNGNKCCFQLKWNTNPIIGTDVSLNEVPITEKLIAINISPKIKTTITSKVKYVSFGMNDETEITPKGPRFYAISATGLSGDELPEGMAVCDNSFMGSYNAFYELSSEKSSSESFGEFHLVFANKVPKLGCTLFDSEGNVLFSGSVAVTGSGEVTTAVVVEDGAGLNAETFEFLNVYPNPNNGQFNLSYATGSKRNNVEIQLVDSKGKVVSTTSSGSLTPGIHTTSVNASKLSRGSYFVRLVSNGKTLSKPVVVQ